VSAEMILLSRNFKVKVEERRSSRQSEQAEDRKLSAGSYHPPEVIIRRKLSSPYIVVETSHPHYHTIAGRYLDTHAYSGTINEYDLSLFRLFFLLFFHTVFFSVETV